MKRKIVPALALAAALVTFTGCASDEPRFDPRSLGRDERAASKEFTPEKLRPLPTTFTSPYLPDENGNVNPPAVPPAASRPIAPASQIVRLPLREITQRAVEHNLNVRVSGYQPAIDGTRITEADARFDPEAFAGVTYTADRQAPSRITNPNSDRLEFEMGLRQLLPSGGQVELSYKPARVNLQDNIPNGTPTPSGIGDNTFWTSAIQLQVTQPLLQNFGADVNQARIVINRYNQRISILEFRKDLEELIQNIEETYWRLYQAQRTQAILEALLQRTIDTADIVSKRFNQDVTLEQISTSVSRVESARADLIRARQRVKDLGDQLKGYMNDPDFPIASETVILAADEPLLTPVTFDFNDSVSTALINRFDLGQQQLRIESANVTVKVAKNNQLPQLNLVGSIGTIGGGQGDRGGNGFDQSLGDNVPATPDSYNSSFGDALDGNFNGQADINWSFGIQFTQKLGNREANAIYRRSQLQRMQAITSYQALVEQATLEVKTATRDIETNWQAIAQTRSAKLAAAKALDVVNDRRETGGEALRPDFIERTLQRQQELANAEQAEAEASAQYNIAISTLERRKGTLLRYNNVILDEKMFQR